MLLLWMYLGFRVYSLRSRARESDNPLTETCDGGAPAAAAAAAAADATVASCEIAATKSAATAAATNS